MPVDHALRIQVDVVCHTANIIGSLCVAVSIGYNPLARLLEIEQCLTDGMGRGWCVAAEDACFDIDAFDVVVVLCFLDGCQDVLQSQVLAHLACQCGQRVSLYALFQLSGEHQGKYGVLLYLCGLGTGCSQSNQRNSTKDSHHNGQYDNTGDGGKNILQKVFHFSF